MVQIQLLLQGVKCGEPSSWHKAECWKMLWTTVGIFNAAAASWEKNPKLGFGGAATQIPTPIIRQYDGDGDDFDGDDDDYIHCMMKSALVCLWVMKNDHFLKKVSRITMWVTKNEHFHNLDILHSCICVFLSDPGPIIVYPCQWLTH